MGNLLGAICCCPDCQTIPALDYAEGRRQILKYNQYRLHKPADIKIIERYIELPSGYLIFTKCYTHLKIKPKGVIFYVYGFSECVDRLETHEKCITFANAGYMAIVHDHKGSGRSEGLWLYVENFDYECVFNANFIHNVCKDIYIRSTHDEDLVWKDLSFIDKLNNYFLFGESMGGTICCKLAMNGYSKDYKAMALIAPMLKIKNPPNFILEKILRLFLVFFPTKEWLYNDIRSYFIKDETAKYLISQRIVL